MMKMLAEPVVVTAIDQETNERLRLALTPMTTQQRRRFVSVDGMDSEGVMQHVRKRIGDLTQKTALDIVCVQFDPNALATTRP